MFHIYCPCCGEYREEEEFHPKGPAHLIRPDNPESCTDAEWGEYLFFRDNPRGVYSELWVHANGCRKFFNIVRNTLTYEILETYKIGERPVKTADAEIVSLPVRAQAAEAVTGQLQAGGGV